MRTKTNLLLLALVSTTAFAAPPKVTGLYSNMRFGTEDVTGVEIFITYSDGEHFAQVQCAEGAISRPIVVPVIVAGSAIRFTIPTTQEASGYSCPTGEFKGSVSGKSLQGKFAGTDWPGLLKRKGSYWQ